MVSALRQQRRCAARQCCAEGNYAAGFLSILPFLVVQYVVELHVHAKLGALNTSVSFIHRLKLDACGSESTFGNFGDDRGHEPLERKDAASYSSEAALHCRDMQVIRLLGCQQGQLDFGTLGKPRLALSALIKKTPIDFMDVWRCNSQD